MAAKPAPLAAPSPSDVDKYQAEDDARTLQRAEDVKMDPKRHGAAKRHARKQLRGLRRITGGR